MFCRLWLVRLAESNVNGGDSKRTSVFEYNKGDVKLRLHKRIQPCVSL